jgi:hypothetical protein
MYSFNQMSSWLPLFRETSEYQVLHGDKGGGDLRRDGTGGFSVGPYAEREKHSKNEFSTKARRIWPWLSSGLNLVLLVTYLWSWAKVPTSPLPPWPNTVYCKSCSSKINHFKADSCLAPAHHVVQYETVVSSDGFTPNA